MKNNLFLAAMLFIASLNISAQKTTPELAVQSAINGFYNGLAALDTGSIKKICTDDLTILESGKLWNIDSLFLRVTNRKSKSNDFKRINKLSFIKTVISKNMAYTYFYNTGVISVDGKTVTVKWLESAVLTKKQDRWKMQFLHSTEMERH